MWNMSKNKYSVFIDSVLRGWVIITLSSSDSETLEDQSWYISH